MEALKTASLTTASTSKSSNLDATSSVKSSKANLAGTPTCQVSVETIPDEDDITCYNAGRPTNSNVIIESTDEEDETYSHPTAKRAPTKKTNPAESKADTCQDEGLNDNEELGKS
jgi:hypothetical protein